MSKNIVFAFCVISAGAFGQGQPRSEMDSRATEVWVNKPKKITAGTVAGEAPSDAIILFDGKDLSKWTTATGAPAKWDVKDGAATVSKDGGQIKTKQAFGDMQLHIEWRTPAGETGEGQHRGNSGVFIQERYEVQVLDSYENETYYNGQAGAIYKQYVPLVNASRKQGEWQTYDIIFTAPRFSDNGGVIIPAYVTVLHNGVLIQNHVQILGESQNQGFPVYTAHGKASLVLQDHQHAVSYRNIWVREL